MNSISLTFWAEYIKIRKSRIFWITIFLFAFMPIMIGLMTYIVRHPEISAKLGILSVKASLFGQANGQVYLGMIHQLIATVGLIGFGFVTAWVFGREHTERTLKDLLALPVSRASFVLGKVLAVLVWCIILSIVLWISAILVGLAFKIPGFTSGIIWDGMVRFFITTGLTALLCPPVAFFAGWGRGLIAPMGFVIFTMIMAQFVALAGLGAWFPWAVPGLYTAPAGTEGMGLHPASYILLGLTFLAGLGITIVWWRKADQK